MGIVHMKIQNLMKILTLPIILFSSNKDEKELIMAWENKRNLGQSHESEIDQPFPIGA